MQKYQWHVAEPNLSLVNELSEALNISPILAKIMVNRGIASTQEATAFLYAGLDSITHPLDIKGMIDTVEILIDSIRENKKFAVYGDYDCDGITSTFVLSTMLRKAGANVTSYIPSRSEEGYGLNKEAILKLISAGVNVLITVDCGIAAVEEIKFAKENNLTCIVTDHHTPPEVLPNSDAIINPRLNPENKTAYDLAGVGVAWKTGWALLEKVLGSDEARKIAFELIDLVALGTVADMVPLLGENRIIVKYGLQQLAETKNLGLQALIRDAGIDGKVDTYKVGFALGPRLNAVGRMSSADKALRLLEETNEAQAKAWAVLLSAENSARQNVEKGILEEAESIITEQVHPEDKVVVIASANWHDGVIGIVASKLLEKRYQPIICLSIKGEEAKGSARSVSGFNIYNAIKACSEHLTRYGGHAMAAGLSLDTAKVEAFRRAINTYAELELTTEMLISKKDVDMELMLEDISSELIDQLSLLEPFGQGNAKPVFLLKNTNISQKKTVGKNNEHLRFNLAKSGKNLQAIAWGMAERLADEITQADIIFTPQHNEFNGKRTIQAVVTDVRIPVKPLISLKDSHVLKLLVKNGKTSWLEIENNAANALSKYFPNRETLGAVYKQITLLLGKMPVCTEEQFRALAKQQNVMWETYYIALIIFYELKLIDIKKTDNHTYFALLNRQEKKVNLEDSPLYRKIQEEYNMFKEIV